MRKHLWICLVLVVSFGCAKSTYLYKSPNKVDAVRVVKADRGESEGGLRHPWEFGPGQAREILRSLRFNQKALLRKDVDEAGLFQERHIEFLAPYLIQAFQKAGPDEVVLVSFFTQSRRFGVAEDRVTIFRAFVKEDGLHFKFTKLHAKLLGDRMTQGRYRATQKVEGLGVSLELAPGQNRISWDPEEILFDLTLKDL